jgi:FkbM family methyltransferase
VTLSTALKLKIAKFACRFILRTRALFGFGPELITTRGGLKWSLDLREGIDLAIYTLGVFERESMMAYRRLILPGQTVLDIGANIGAHTLHLARCAGQAGKVIAFEPTDFAFKKLNMNVSLNPKIKKNIELLQIFLISSPNTAFSQNMIYSSWPLTDDLKVHSKHGGKLKSSNGATSATLDDVVSSHSIQDVNFIKLDVDGNEINVLQGGIRTLERYRPIILMELAPYVFDQEKQSFEQLCSLIKEIRYRFININSKIPLPHDTEKLRALIPDGAGINVLAQPY